VHVAITDGNDDGNVLLDWSSDDSKHLDSFGRLLNHTSKAGVQSAYTYDNYGNMLTNETVSGNYSIKTTNEYINNGASDDGNFLKKITDPIGNTKEYTYNRNDSTLSNQKDGKENTLIITMIMYKNYVPNIQL